MSPRIYLAGPDVFHPDARAIGAAKKALCAERGFTGLYPLDGDVAPRPPAVVSRAIYDRCLAMMAEADVGLFNLTPFRGPSADPGTVAELAHMAALGKPVFAYTNAGGDLIDRLRETHDLTYDGAVWRDTDGLQAEDFGNVDNLMIDETLDAQGRRIHRNQLAPAQRGTDLAGFSLCLDEVAAWARGADCASPRLSKTRGGGSPKAVEGIVSNMGPNEAPSPPPRRLGVYRGRITKGG